MSDNPGIFGSGESGRGNMSAIQVHTKTLNGEITYFHILSPRPNGPDVCIDLTPAQAESLARTILIKLKKERVTP